MAEQLLDGDQVRAAIEQMRREAVPQRVRGQRFVITREAKEMRDNVLDPPARKTAATLREEQGLAMSGVRACGRRARGAVRAEYSLLEVD